MTAPLGNLPLCMETRMMVAAGTGISTYARALHAAHAALSTHALVLSGGDASAPGSAQSPYDRVTRGLRAVIPWPVKARSRPGGFVRYDVFRLAHAYFTVHGQLLPVRLPGRSGIMHWSYPVPLRVAGWRNLYTVHDVIPLTDPALSPIDGLRHRRLLGRIAQGADMLVTVSQAAARTIASELDMPSERIADCSQSVDIGRGVVGSGPLPAGLVPGGYLLVCGAVEPRKNIERVVAAYRASGTTLPLVIVGPDGWGSDTVSGLLSGTRGVVRLPYQSRNGIVALLAHARALVMVSLAEGFGLPVAEAMALGTPVITSTPGALTDTAGGAALLVNPYDTDAIAAAILAIERDDALWQNLSDAGRRRAAAFAPDHFAVRLRTLYEGLAPAA